MMVMMVEHLNSSYNVVGRDSAFTEASAGAERIAWLQKLPITLAVVIVTYHI
nr:hypothetical protein Iba_chr09eCG9090 [Ipomoea batatas]